MPDAGEVQRMFARVAPRYDRLNSVLSCGVDASWRRAAVRYAEVERGEAALDVCTGTARLARELERAGARVVGCDFCVEMLQRAVGGRLVGGDALRLPFRDCTFRIATIGFGIRNVADPLAGLQELRRVLGPGGRLIVLEFARPRGGLAGAAYRFYFQRILPRIGRWLAPGAADAYRYLPESVMAFPEREEFLALLEAAGFLRPRMRLLTGGIAALYRGEVGAG